MNELKWHNKLLRGFVDNAKRKHLERETKSLCLYCSAKLPSRQVFCNPRHAKKFTNMLQYN